MYGYGSNQDSGGKCHHNDHYDSREAAKEAAKRMGKSGCHRMTCNGKTVYMPGSSHADYMDMNDGGYGGGGGSNKAGIDPSDFGL
jgi:hypothetical protein